METNNVSEIVTGLIAGKFTSDELARIGQAYAYARENLRYLTRRALTVGMRVQWESRKTGNTVLGTVYKLGPKNAYVRDTSGRQWVVTTSMLKVLA